MSSAIDNHYIEGIRNTSIVIALKDDIRILKCMDSIDEDVEVVLALNGTPSHICDKIRDHPKRPVLTQNGEPGNLGAAYNAGIEAASKRYILLMDSDCLFGPGTIGKMASLATRYPVVKGQVTYGIAPGLVSKLIARIREFDEGDYVSALSPPLIYDRELSRKIGGHFSSLIHWCEDREFDFRMQMANIPVLYEGSATIHHDAQVGIQDLRSYWRYGIGEAIGQELGIFTTPLIPFLWRFCSDLRTVLECSFAKGALAGAYYCLTLLAFHSGTAWHKLRDPYNVKRRYPDTARKVRMLWSIPQHCTILTDKQKQKLMAHHKRAGVTFEPSMEYVKLLEQVKSELSKEKSASAEYGLVSNYG